MNDKPEISAVYKPRRTKPAAGGKKNLFLDLKPSSYLSHRTLNAKRRSGTRIGGVEIAKQKTGGKSAAGCGEAAQYTKSENRRI
jgi:hypothetical protein